MEPETWDLQGQEKQMMKTLLVLAMWLSLLFWSDNLILT